MCATGWTLEGSNSVTCENGGSSYDWTEIQPTCVGKSVALHFSQCFTRRQIKSWQFQCAKIEMIHYTINVWNTVYITSNCLVNNGLVFFEYIFDAYTK